MEEVRNNGSVAARYKYLADGTKLEVSDPLGGGYLYFGSLIYNKRGNIYVPEMLFVDPDVRGCGLGRQLVGYAVRVFSTDRVCVNEQNPHARGFYEHLGFHVERRTERDEQGRPFPLLYLRIRQGE